MNRSSIVIASASTVAVGLQIEAFAGFPLNERRHLELAQLLTEVIEQNVQIVGK